MQIRALERKVSTLPRLVGARIPLLRAAGVGGYITGEPTSIIIKNCMYRKIPVLFIESKLY